MIHMSTNIKCYYDKINELNGKRKMKKNKRKKSVRIYCYGAGVGGTCGTWIRPPSHASTARDKRLQNRLCGSHPLIPPERILSSHY